MSDVQQPFSDPSDALNVDETAAPSSAAPANPESAAADSPVAQSSNGAVILLPKVDTTTPDYAASIFPIIESQPSISIGWMPEDSNSKQHTGGEEDTHGAEIKVRVGKFDEFDPVDSYLTQVKFTQPTTSLSSPYFTIDDAEYYVTVKYGDKEEGNEYHKLSDGDVLQDYAGNKYQIQLDGSNLTINIDSSSSTWKPVDLSQLGLFVKPGNVDASGMVAVKYDISCANDWGNPATLSSVGYIYVDAVADRPVYGGGANEDIVLGPKEDGTLTVTEEGYKDGNFTQTISGGAASTGEPLKISLGNIRFGDYTDGSEEHFVLVAVNEGLAWTTDQTIFTSEDSPFYIPPSEMPESGPELETVWLDAEGNFVAAGTPGARAFTKLGVNSAYLAAHDGVVDVQLPVNLPADLGEGEYTFEIKAGAVEQQQITWVLTEKDYENNTALTDIDPITVKVQPLATTVTVASGWAYESGAAAGGTENPDADPAATGAAAGESTQLREGLPASAAVIRFTITPGEGESLSQYIELSYDKELGDIYFKGTKYNSVSGDKAFATLSVSDILEGQVAYFVPNPALDADQDISLSYTFTVTKGTGETAKTFTATGELPIVLDAVADPAEVVEIAPSGEAPDVDGFTLDYTVRFRADSAETQYIVIANPDGLLALGDLGDLAAALVPASLGELTSLENASADVGWHADGIGPHDIILRIEDLASLAAADGTVALKLPMTVTDRAAAGSALQVDVTTIVVQGGGNNEDNWDQQTNREYDFANNIAAETTTTTVELAQAEMSISVNREVFEGDRPAQHELGEVEAAPAYGTPLDITFGDAGEAVRELRFHLSTADDSPVDGSIAFGLGTDYTLVPEGGSLRFTATAEDGVARYTAVEILDAAGGLVGSYAIEPPATLAELHAREDASGLRFIPSGDNDADVRVEINARVMDARSGDVITLDSLPALTIIRDAVADKPLEAAASVLPQDGYTAVVAGEPVTLRIGASLGDVTDGSEAHYVFVSRELLDSLNVPSSPSGALTLLNETEAAAVCAQVDGQPYGLTGGIPGASPADYFILRVEPSWLAGHTGPLDVTLQATLKSGLTADGNDTLDVRLVSVEHEGFATDTSAPGDGETDASNNVAVAEVPAALAWATLENAFTFDVPDVAYENDQPGQHQGDTTEAGGAAIRITPQDAGEVFDELTVTCIGQDGEPAAGSVVLDLDGVVLTIPDGATLHFTYESPTSARCIEVSYTDAGGTAHTLAVPHLTLAELSAQGLRYVPAAEDNHSDVDVRLTFSGVTRETKSGETGTFGPAEVLVQVDAVADRAAGETTEYAYGVAPDGHAYTALPEGGAVSFAVNATFADYEDGSEAQYLFVDTRLLAEGSLQLLDGGQPFAGGTLVTGEALTGLLAGIGGHPGLSPDTGAAYVVWRLDPAYLKAHGGELSLTVKGTLKDAAALTELGPQKSLLDMDVKAVSVEYDGYLTQTAAEGGPDVRADNNVAVTDIGTRIRWDALAGEFTPSAEPAHEDDLPGQHQEGTPSPQGGAALTITPQDATEVLTSLKLEYDDSHGQFLLHGTDAAGQPATLTLASGAELTFAFDPAAPTHITSVSCGGATLSVPGLTLAELTGGGLRYVPAADDKDADVLVTLSGQTLETTTGVDGTWQAETTVVVDAVADRPQEVASSVVILQGRGDTAIVNEAQGLGSVELHLSATFADHEDGSEAHYFLVSGEYLAALEGVPAGLTLLGAEAAAEVTAQAGLTGEYFVLRAEPSLLAGTGGVVDAVLTARLDPSSLPDEDQPLTVDIKAAAIEHQGLLTPVDAPLGGTSGSEADAANNVSLVDAGVTLHYARLDNDFDVSAAAYEDDAPGQHTGNWAPGGGAAIDFAPSDASEVFDTLVVDYEDTAGSLTLTLPTAAGNVLVDVPDGTQLSFAYRNEGAGATLCKEVTVTQPNGESTTYTLVPQLELRELMADGRLRYTPDTDTQSDADVDITFSGTSRETATGETGSYSHTLTVRMDAVADMPLAFTGDVANADTGRPVLAPEGPCRITLDVDFGADLEDGSERHYVFVSRQYLAGLSIPAELGAAIMLLPQTAAAAVCDQVRGAAGMATANADDWFVLAVDAQWLRDNGGKAVLDVEATLKDAARLEAGGATEGAGLTLDMKAVAVEHDGLLTATDADLGAGHGQDVTAENNVAVRDVAVDFTYAAVDGQVSAQSGPAYEGDQPRQHEGDTFVAGGAPVTLAPEDASEVFAELTLDYDAANGSLQLASPGGDPVTLADGARLVFTYAEEDPTLCLSVQVWQPGDTAPSATLSFADAGGNGMSLADLTSGYLRYLPAIGNDQDADVSISCRGILRETDSGAQGPFSQDLTVVVDAVADLASDAAGSAVVGAGADAHPAATPGETFTITLSATFSDYGAGDASDVSEAHYLFIARENLPALVGSLPEGVSLVSDASELADIFGDIAQPEGMGIHAGAGAASAYHVLRVSSSYLSSVNGTLSLHFSTVAGEVGTYPVEVKAVSVEYDGYRTNVDDVDGGGTNRDVTAENNVAVADMSFELMVREFTPDKITVTQSSEWAYENDRSEGDEQYHAPGDETDRDHGVDLHFSGQGEGNVISSVTFEFPMPSNGSGVPHRIESVDENGEPSTGVTISVDTTSKPGMTIVTVTSDDPYGSVGNLRFVPGDNYDNADVDITVTHVEVSDPFLHQSTKDDPDWGNGLAEGGGDLHVKVDAVAQAPEVDIFGVVNAGGSTVKAGEVIHIAGEISYEDTADGSEEHFLLLEVRDGYYPDEVTLTLGGHAVTIPVEHYQAGPPPVEANYVMQQLVTEDDGQPHLFIKLPVDGALAQLMGDTPQPRLDGIELDVAYQTRDWAAEGTSLHFAAIASEDVENVREYDADWNITNDELPFDKQLEQHVPGLTVTDNNTAITVAAQAAWVYWDEVNSNAINFRGYVFENDRPADHQRDPNYVLDWVDPDRQDVIYSYPLAPELTPFDETTGRDYGTAMDLEIPSGTRQVTLTQIEDKAASGSFYFLPEAVWTAYMQSPAPLKDSGLSKYLVQDNVTATATEAGEYMLVFIPTHEAYGDPAHTETGGSHRDVDYRFNYELLVNQYDPVTGELRGTKKYLGENMVIRVDAVANQAELLSAGTEGTDQFSLWGGKDTTSTFDLSVRFHDLDATEDHYILVEMVPNFAFRCGSYQYIPGQSSISPSDNESIYTHVMTDADGNQTFIRYYKIPVSMADIDPVTGEATVKVEFLRQAGMPSVADYPASQELTYGALTEDKTSSRWDSQDPTSPNFINRKGADGEYSYENNTSVIIRNGIDNGADDAGMGPGWVEEIVDGSIHWTNGPGRGWSGGWWPGNEEGGSLDGYWRPDGPGGGGDWWGSRKEGGTIGGTGTVKDWIPGDGGGWKDLDGGGSGGPGGEGGDNVGGGGGGVEPGGSNNPWVASRGQGLAIEWVFENGTPLGHTQAGQYNNIMPTRIHLTGDVAQAATLVISIPDVESGMIFNSSGGPSAWEYVETPVSHPKAVLGLGMNEYDAGMTYITGVLQGNEWVFTIPVENGQLPAGQNLFMLVSPDSKGEDFQMDVQWKDAAGNELSSGPVDVLVDAVAQWANFSFAGHEDGVYGVTGEDPTSLLRVDVDVNYLDRDGSETNYLLVEKIPGVLPLYEESINSYAPLREVYLEGTTYYLIEPNALDQKAGTVSLYVSVNEELLSPMYVRDDLEYKGHLYTGVRLTVGTMTVEGQIGHGVLADAPANWEYTLDNNTSLNLKEDYLSIFVSRVDATGGDNTVLAVETANPEEHLLQLDPTDPANALNLRWDGNDVLTSLIFTEASGNGSFWYKDDNEVLHPLPLDEDMSAAYLAGRIYYRQDRYQDADAHLSWKAEVRDGITENSTASLTGTLTVAVDAVADAAEITLGYPLQDKAAGTLTQTLTFADHESNEQHYAVIAPDLYRVVGKQAEVLGPDGAWHAVAVETIFDPSGNPYYAVRLDGLLDASGSATVRFSLHELNVPGIENFPVISGGVSIEPNSGYFADDREPNLANNWAINTRAEKVGQGVISTTDLSLHVADALQEDDPQGAAILLDGTPGEHDALVSAVLRLVPQAGSPAFSGQAGQQVATIVYDGQCFAVRLDGTGAAVAEVGFGTGFDPAADFRIIWGEAQMVNGQLVVSQWNHAADGTLDLQADLTVSNVLSGQTVVLSGTDPDGLTLVARADAAQDVGGALSAVNGQPAAPEALVGAAADSLTITLHGSFADVDGSEAHYLLLEVPQGWQVLSPAGAALVQIDGVSYCRVAVDPGQTDPTAEVTLLAADGLNGPVSLATGAQAVEQAGGHSAFTPGGQVSLTLSDVSATGPAVTSAAGQEDTPLSLADLGLDALSGNDGNDVLLSLTFTDLAGGSLVDAAGDPLPSLTLTAADLASGNVFYRPAPNYAGELDAQGRPLPVSLGYEALLGESDTGATATRTGLSLSLSLTPVADAPTGVIAACLTPAIEEVQTGHKAAVSVSLAANFADADGSEQHFFVLRAPQGVAVAAGAGYTLGLLSAAEAEALGLAAQYATGTPLYKLTLTDGTAASVSLSVNLEVTTTLYNGGSLEVLGAAAERLADGSWSYAGTAGTGAALPPPVGHDIGNNAPEPADATAAMDSLRQDSLDGTLDLTDIDPDGDTVLVSGLSFGDTPAEPGTQGGQPCWTVRGQYGTLLLLADGSYTYTLDPDHQGATGSETFAVSVADAYGGTAGSQLTITLAAPNEAPDAASFSAALDSVRAATVEKALDFTDPDGDAVEVAAVNGSSDQINFGTAEAPLMGFEVRGDYGTLRVWQAADGQWRSSYTLDAEHRGETRDETFSLTLRDAHGLTSQGTLTVDLINENSAPVAQDAGASLDTLRDADGMVAGSLFATDADADPLALAGASGPGGAGVWGQDDAGATALVVQGGYGVLYLYQTGEGMSYRYVLTAEGGVDAVESFTYTVDDGYLGTGSASLDIHLSKANSAPEITGQLSATLDTLRDGGELHGQLALADPDYNVDAGRHDRVTLSGLSSGGTPGTADGAGGFTVSGRFGVLHVDASGAYVYTLNEDAAGVQDEETFTLTVTDEFGATSSRDISFDLLVRNTAPVTSSPVRDLDTWRGGGQVEGALQLSDADGDIVRVHSASGAQAGVWGTDPQGRPALVVQGGYGVLYLREDGSYSYQLAEGAQGAQGEDVFNLAVRDGFGGEAAGSITIRLDNPNTAPEVSGDLAPAIGGDIAAYPDGVVRESGHIAWQDAEGDALAAVSVGGVVLPASGTVSIEGLYGTLVITSGDNGADYVYTLREGLDAQGITDVDSFAVEVRDIYGATATQDLVISLAPLSHAPECDDVNHNWPYMPSGMPISALESELSFRDADMAYDPAESLQLAVNGVAVAPEGETTIIGQHGKLQISADGSFTYTSDYVGDPLLEDFTYTVTDTTGNTAEAHLYIRLGDGAPAFPNTGLTEEGVIPRAEALPALFGQSDAAPWADFGEAAAQPAESAATPEHAPAADPAADPAEIGLASVPLPYDVDGLQHLA